MAIKVMTWAFDESPTDGAERLVLLALADNSSEEGYCWPSLLTISRKGGIARRSAIRLIAQLESKGILTVQRRWDEAINTNKTNMYRICWTDGIRAEEQVGDRYARTLAEWKNSRSRWAGGGDRESLGVVTESHQGGDRESLGVVTHGHQPSDIESPKSLINRKSEPALKPLVEPPPPAGSNAASVQEEEVLPGEFKLELQNYGVFAEVLPKIAATMAARNLAESDVRGVLLKLREKHEPERAASLLLTRLKNTRPIISAIGYTNSSSGNAYPVCRRCGSVHTAEFTRTVNGKAVCLDCLTDDEYSIYFGEGGEGGDE
jgi:hypothetical protein